jgi:hypothetical protein
MTSARSLPDSSVEGLSMVDPMFESVTVDRLDREHFLKLGAGILGAVRVRNFFDISQCEQIMVSLEDCVMGSYDEQIVQPRVPKLGPAAFDYYKDGAFSADYWEHAEQSAATRAGLLSDADPLDVAMTKLAGYWAGPVRQLTATGRPLFAGMIREVNNGGGIHYDELAREFPGAADETLLAQIAFNCHVSMPESGGALNVFRRRWQPSDDAIRGSGYFYPAELLTGEQYVSVLASVGDAVLFDSRNYHRVLPCADEGRRVTLSFFIGVSGSGELVVWS